jgi:hypothetical protein
MRLEENVSRAPTDRSWPPAGSWIRRSFAPARWLPARWATERWHRFTGDADWKLGWPGPSLRTECGYSTGPLMPLDDLRVERSEPDQPCRHCLDRALHAGPGD